MKVGARHERKRPKNSYPPDNFLSPPTALARGQLAVCAPVSGERWRAATPHFSVLFLGTLPVVYLASLLALVLNSYVALATAIALGSLVAVLRPEVREDTLNGRQLAVVAVGLVLVAQTREPVGRLHWDVVSYGLMRYPEMKHWVVGPYFSYGHVYEFVVSYINELLPPATGLTLGHSMSLFFLAVGALTYASATGSIVATTVCLGLLLWDPTGLIQPILSYAYAGKNDVLLAAVVLFAWAVFLDRQRNRERPVAALEFVATNALAAYAVGLKTSAVIALGLPLTAYWWELISEKGTWRRLAQVGCLAGVPWLLFCWQYLVNIAVFGNVMDPVLSAIGIRLSGVGTRWPLPVGVVVCTCVLVVLIGVGLIQRAGRDVLMIRTSALSLLLLCPFLLYEGQPPQWRLVLPVLFLAGIDAASVVATAAQSAVFGPR